MIVYQGAVNQNIQTELATTGVTTFITTSIDPPQNTTITFTSNGSTFTVTSTVTTETTTIVQQGTSPFWNVNSQRVANYLITNGWSAAIGLLHDTEPTCKDYVGAYPCDQTYWTTSDNVPTCDALGGFGYSDIMQACDLTLQSLGAFTTPNSGQRYEAYDRTLIVEGNPGDEHTILQPPNGSNRIICEPVPPSCPGNAYGTLNGVPYAIQADAWNGNGGGGTTNPSGCVDTVASQAINYWNEGKLSTGQNLVGNLISRWDGFGLDKGKCGNVDSSGNPFYSTWQLGQFLFDLQVYGYAFSNSTFTTQAGVLTGNQIWDAAVNQLWSVQAPDGYLPNSYYSLGVAGSGRDPENQDAGILPFSWLVPETQADFGKLG